MDAYKTILLIHVAFGFSALATGIVPMVAKKGGKVHKFWGNVYYWAMFGVFITTLMLFALRPGQLQLQFFLCIAILSFYFTFSGDRVLKMKKSATQATAFDRVAAGLALACGLAMLGYAVYGVMGPKNYYIAILFAVFGMLISLNARKDLQLFFGKIDSEKMHWYFGHISKMMGAYIATITAFCVNMTRYLPEDASIYLQLIPWLAPGVLLGVGTAYYGKRQREKRSMPVEYGFITSKLRKILVKDRPNTRQKSIIKRLPFTTLVFMLLARLSMATTDSQRLIGQLTDGQQQPLAYASIGVIDSPVGTVADAQGRFILYITDKVSQTDTVLISLIGYRSRRLSVADLGASLNANSQLTMEEDIRQLSEVIITVEKSRVRTLGKSDYQTKMTTNFALSELPRQNLGAEIGRRFNVSKGINYLETYRFYLISNFDSTSFRINVYRAKNMKNLLSQNIYITVPGKARQWVEVDLTPYQIITTEDMIISVQWVDSFGEGTALKMPIGMPAAATHYYRYGSQDRWRKFRGMSTAMNLTFTRSRKATKSRPD